MDWYSMVNDCHCDTYSAMGMEEDASAEKLTWYPNPSSGRFSLDFEKPTREEYAVNIFSLRGKLMHSVKLNKQRNIIDLPELADGMYFVTVEDGQGHRWTRRLIKASE